MARDMNAVILPTIQLDLFDHRLYLRELPPDHAKEISRGTGKEAEVYAYLLLQLIHLLKE
jgi:hypothetical protein